MVLFEKQELLKSTFWDRIFRRVNKDNALIELHNLFAAKDVQRIRYEDVCEISYNYQVVFRKAYNKQILAVYEKYLVSFLEDKKLSNKEIDALQHLKQLLSLTDEEVQTIHRNAAGKIYQQELDNALQDNQLSGEEAAFLKQLQEDLRLSDEYVGDIFSRSAKERIERVLSEIMSDERVSPQEEQELASIAKNLNISFNHCPKTKAQLEKYKLFWQIENGTIPTIDVSINLQKDERCHFTTGCTWFEQRRVTKRINYSGPTLRFKIIKGVYWRAGSLKPQIISEDQWLKIDRGDFLITNKRLIFMGQKGNKTIKISSILDYAVFANGVEIGKDRGKSPFIGFTGNNDLAALILGRVITEQ